MCTSSSSQLSSGFDWSEEGSVGEKTQNNKRQREDDDGSSDSETEVSEQVMREQVNCALIERGMKLCYLSYGFHFVYKVCQFFVQNVQHFLTQKLKSHVFLTKQK